MERKTRVKMCNLLAKNLFKTTSGGFKHVLGSGWPVWPLKAHHHPDRLGDNTVFYFNTAL